VNDVTISPFKRDKSSFLIGNRNGGLSFIDLEIQVKKGDCFTFIKMLYNLDSMDDVLKMIDKDFHLGISSNIYRRT
jgi:hypothetical protein